MKLVLLPGLDGTGRLFRSFADALGDSVDISIIALPTGDDQSYEYLTKYVKERLPVGERFVVLAESFSGPIAYRLLLEEIPNIQSAIFVATFLRNPSWMTECALLAVRHFALKKSPLTNTLVKAGVAHPSGGFLSQSCRAGVSDSCRNI